ncbi:zinc finger protein ush isoform X2 [Parasteatoda tepidariorum]|uniref:zinc finger protein ush isoform X2 n=1 Tax=Parasteatoda tepidariorum TaxID=114398 RepID=UPI00077FC50F
MSRRKQSNPKPLKRKTEDTLEEVSELLHLPTDIFSVRDPEDDVHEYTVFTRQRLREGVVFGPFTGHVIKDDCDSLNVIETKDEEGRALRFAVTDESGGWLKLLKSATSGSNPNTSLSHNESSIWCTITSDIEADTEILVSHCWSAITQKSDVIRNDFQTRTHSKHLLHKNKSNRAKRRSSDSQHTDDSEIDERDEIRNLRTKQARSPQAYDENTILNKEQIYNGNASREAEFKYETSSPASTRCSVGSPSASASGKQDSERTEDRTAATLCVPYINGCNYPMAFPYCGMSEADGLYKCENCAINFNSRRVLEAHQSLYCQGKTYITTPSSDTDTEDNQHTNNKTDTTNISSSSASEEGENHVNKEYSVAKKQDVVPQEDPSFLAKRRRTASVNELSPVIPRLSRLFKCPYCSYSSDKKASLTRHIRMHGQSPGTDGQCDIPLATPPMARYCANCDIQFTAYKNYLVHKELYCSTRHVHKSIPPSSSPNSGNSSQQQPPSQSQPSQPRSPEQHPAQQQEQNPKNYNMVLNQPLYAAISTSPLILVPCSYVAGGGLSPAAGLVPAGNIIIPNPSASPDGVTEPSGTNVIPTYTVMPGAAPDVNSVSPSSGGEDATKDDVKPVKPVKEKTVKQDVCKSPKEPQSVGVETPLDLSIKKRDDSMKLNSVKSPQESGVRRIPVFTSLSTASTDESTKQTPSTAHTLPVMPIVNPGVELNLLARAQMPCAEPPAPVLGPPQVLVKQGTSKCNECNIVFYKYENYLVHKNRYCASRTVQQKPEVGSPERIKSEDADSSDRDETLVRQTQKSPLSSPRVNNTRTPPVSDVVDSRESSPNQQHAAAALLQYYCMACGIKYSSIDNLRAHQLYYCPKREVNTAQPVALVPSFSRNNQEYKCTKCKNAYPTEELLRQHPCVVQRKCPYCDVYCPTLSAAQRHLVTHTGIKSFRCSLCGYKGHTLRGMRTHIRIHLDKNSSTPEEAYILCMDEGGTEIGCASRKPSGSRLNSDRIKSVIGTEPPQGETVLAVSPVSGPSPTMFPTDIVAIKAVPDDPVATGDTTHWCQICGYSSSYKGNVVRHVKLVHKDLISSQTMSNIVNSRPSLENHSKTNDSMESVRGVTPHDSAAEHSNSSSSLDVKPIVNGILSKNEQPLRVDDKTLILKSETVSPPPPSTAASSKGIKRPLTDEGQCQAGTYSSKAGAKYCKSCDISFNYLSNFLAHKKFYCTPRSSGEVAGQEASTVQSVQ